MWTVGTCPTTTLLSTLSECVHGNREGYYNSLNEVCRPVCSLNLGEGGSLSPSFEKVQSLHDLNCIQLVKRHLKIVSARAL